MKRRQVVSLPVNFCEKHKVVDRWYESILHDVQLPSAIDTRQASSEGGCSNVELEDRYCRCLSARQTCL